MAFKTAPVHIEATAAGSVSPRPEGVIEYHCDTDKLYVSDGTNKNQVYPSTGSSLSRCRVTKSADQGSVGSGTEITWDQEDFDNATLHDNSTNNQRLTVPTGGAGLWLIGTFFQVATTTATPPVFWIYKNGSGGTAIGGLSRTYNTGAVSKYFVGSTLWEASDADYFVVAMSSGSSCTVSATGASFWMVRLGP